MADKPRDSWTPPGPPRKGGDGGVAVENPRGWTKLPPSSGKK